MKTIILSALVFITAIMVAVMVMIGSAKLESCGMTHDDTNFLLFGAIISFFASVFLLCIHNPKQDETN